MSRVHIDTFQSADTVTRKTTYEELKRAVLAVGKFSCFEASANMRAAILFSQLCHDPEIEMTDMGYPWTGVRRKGAV